MADNVGYTPGTGATVAADDIAGVLYQRVKIGVGADGSATDVSTANPMPITAPSALSVTVGNFPVSQAVTGPLTNTELRASPIPAGVPSATSVVIMSLTTAATGSNYTAFSSQTCNSLDIVNSSSVSIEYRRGAAGNSMTILSGSSRLVVGITNANQIDVRRVDLSNTQITIPAEAITV